MTGVVGFTHVVFPVYEQNARSTFYRNERRNIPEYTRKIEKRQRKNEKTETVRHTVVTKVMFRFITSLNDLHTTTAASAAESRHQEEFIAFQGTVIDIDFHFERNLRSDMSSVSDSSVCIDKMDHDGVTVPSPQKKQRITRYKTLPAMFGQQEAVNSSEAVSSFVVLNNSKSRKRKAHPSSHQQPASCGGEGARKLVSARLLIEDVHGGSIWVEHRPSTTTKKQTNASLSSTIEQLYLSQNVRVYGKLCSSTTTSHRMTVLAHCIVPLSSLDVNSSTMEQQRSVVNEISRHPLDRIHGFTFKGHGDGDECNDDSDIAVHTMIQNSNNSPEQTSSSQRLRIYKAQNIVPINADGVSDVKIEDEEDNLQKEILRIVKAAKTKDGIKIDVLAQSLAQTYTSDRILLALNRLAESGLIYTGITEGHFCCSA